MNYVVKDGAFYMTFLRQGPEGAQRPAQSKVALLVETGDSYAELAGCDGTRHCEIIEDTEAVKAMFAFRADARGHQSTRPGAGASAPKRVVLKVVPHRVASWDHRKLGGGY